MSNMTRREALRLMALVPLAGSLGCTMQDIGEAALQVDELNGFPLEPQFFTPAEWRTVSVLADMVIPADEKSGSATDAQVPEFMDFMLNETSDSRQQQFRDGLGWLDSETRRRHGVAFAEATDAQRRDVLDDIAWPDRAPQELEGGVEFFNRFRDMTAAGFFSSRIGYEDLEFRGNEFVAQWQGCPQEALDKLGVSYDIMEKA
ncbi:MAG TPA: gluconate 2-dehydrogenase subunit 3 family protein [Longimicrobiales bacterium]|nr:gluconate 2-dehydrogenase subunit 3 family protein [Longimicrobiales bacterium]